MIKLQQLLPELLRTRSYREISATVFLIVGAVQFSPANHNIKEVASTYTSIKSISAVEAIPITGNVTDQNGAGLLGATVIIKGTTQGTTTDIDGNFSLEVPDTSSIIVISYAGYKEQEVKVGTQTTLKINLKEDVQMGEEVVVVGYGVQKKTSITGAISSVAAKEISAVPVANISGALQGRAAGVIVTSNGAPGMAPIVRIRGNGSIGLSADPLYVVDGVPITDPNFLNYFDSKDIENMEVLKDAASSAIYGSRASNGVILITTKKGSSKDKKFHVNLDTYAGTQSVWKKLELLNTEQYINYAQTLSTNGGTSLPERLLPANFDQPIYTGASTTFSQTKTDWQDELFRSALISQTHLSMSGKTDISRVYISGGYFKQQGTMVGTGFERGNVRINSEHDLSKKFKVGQTLSFAYGHRDNETGQEYTQGRSLIMHTIRSLPYLPVHDPTRNGGYLSAQPIDGSDVDNPIKDALLFKDNTYTGKLFGTVFVDYSITEWLKYRSTVGLDYTNGERRTYLPIYNDGFNSRPNAQLVSQITNDISPLFSNQLAFDKSFGKHTINAVAVAEQQGFTTRRMNTQGNLSFNGSEELNNVSSPSIIGTKQQNYLISYVGRLNYDFGGKYLIGLSLRSDGSSKFAPGNRWGTFPAASAGWRISEESFMKSIAAISELKIRGSYGLVGFNGIGNYDYMALQRIDQTLNHFNGTNVEGSYFNAFSNPKLKWETSKMLNIGVDVALLNNRFTFSAEYFNKETENLILPVNVAPSLGYTILPISNLGSMRNSGFEFQGGFNVASGGFRSNLTGNLAFVQNKVLTFTSPSANIQAGYTGNPDFGGYNITITQAGIPVQSFYGWKTDGLFQNQEEIDQHATQDGAAPGDIRFKDLNNDRIINDADRTVLGSYLPKFTYGLNYNASYKNFDLSIFFQGVHGNQIYNGTKVLTQGMVRLFNAGVEVQDAWTPTNTNTEIPRTVGGDPNNNARTSDRFLESGSYLRLKNVSLGYTLPENLVKSITGGNLSTVRFYLTGTNLLTFTKYTGYDPEIALGPRLAASGGDNVGTLTGVSNLLTSGIDYGQAPQARAFMGGIQIGF